MLHENKSSPRPSYPAATTIVSGEHGNVSIFALPNTTTVPILALSGYDHRSPYRYLPWGGLL